MGTQGVGRRQASFALIVGIALIGAAIVATPYAGRKLIAIPSYMAMFGAAMVTINMPLAALLFSRGSVDDSGDAIRLGAAYLFVGCIFIPLTASFPGGVMPEPLIGQSASAVWLWSYWHVGFALAIMRYAWFAHRRPAQRSSVVFSILAVLAAVLVGTLIATRGLDMLPPVLRDGTTLVSGSAQSLPDIVLLITLAAFASVLSLRARKPEQLWLTVGMVATCVDVWLTFHGGSRFSLGWYLAKAGSLFASLAVLISLFHDITLLHAQAAASNRHLASLARVDGLTGLANRRCFDETLDVEWRRARRDGRPLSLLMIDVDHFKAFNDSYGHLQGDECLRLVARNLRLSARRPADLAARYGGEEFAMLLPDTSAADAVTLAERVRSGIQGLAVTVSIGVATATPGPNHAPLDLVEAADQRLYSAKHAGRNRVEGPPAPVPVSIAS